MCRYPGRRGHPIQHARCHGFLGVLPRVGDPRTWCGAFLMPSCMCTSVCVFSKIFGLFSVLCRLCWRVARDQICQNAGWRVPNCGLRSTIVFCISLVFICSVIALLFVWFVLCAILFVLYLFCSVYSIFGLLYICFVLCEFLLLRTYLWTSFYVFCICLLDVFHVCFVLCVLYLACSMCSRFLLFKFVLLYELYIWLVLYVPAYTVLCC